MKWRGKTTKGVNPIFLGRVAAAAKAAGATYIYVISAKRTPATNTGVSNSNHLYGHALDGYAYVPGQGKVPLGTLLKDSASSYGLRSGDQPGFYKGAPDPNHVDDGYNVNHGKPLSSSTAADEQAAQTTPPAADQTQDDIAREYAMQDAIGQIPQEPGPPEASVAEAGTFNSPPAGAVAPAQTWQLIATNGPVSQDTLRLAQLAGYGDGQPSLG